MSQIITSTTGKTIGTLEYDDGTGRWVAETVYGAVKQFSITSRDAAQGASSTKSPDRAIKWVYRQHYGQ